MHASSAATDNAKPTLLRLEKRGGWVCLNRLLTVAGPRLDPGLDIWRTSSARHRQGDKAGKLRLEAGSVLGVCV